jgi:hypothetical protein
MMGSVLTDPTLGFATPGLEVVRYGPPLRDGALRIGNGTEERFSIDGSFQPLKQSEQRLLPEGTRADGAAKIFTSTKLRTVEASESKKADRLWYDGVEYEVVVVDNWSSLGDYYRAVLARVTP